ncbi:hypothetical protein, conserved [Babesia ovata]|uniref:C3H1-type domain-containing protein n=1 Tax=Babesia ovata TaxID=189622 RepID=A0A2H6KJR6_9APIC|nr:uncharacterized protein BOVATA_047130 [Babesia ovata]GBE63220.1 hypothetical protein, conserved [Babesia ovata]
MEQVKTAVSGIFPELNKKKKDAPPPEPKEYSAEDIDRLKSQVDAKLLECQQHAQTFRQGIARVSRSVNDLNHEAKEKVETAKNSVWLEGKRLEGVSENEKRELAEMERKIISELDSLGSSVKDEIGRKLRTLVEEIKRLITLMLKDLRHINVNLESYGKDLQNWINNADGIVGGAMKDVKKIEDKHVGLVNQDAIRNKAREVNEWKQKLDGYITSVKSSLGSLASTATEKLKELDNAYKNKLLAITKAVEKVPEAIKKLGEKFPDKSRTAPTSIDKIFENIRNTVAQIKGESGGSFIMGFEGFKEVFKVYAEGFKKGKFEDIVKSWSNEIVDKVGGASGLRGYLVSHRKLGHGNGGNLNKLLLAIKREIPSQLKSEVIEVAAQTFSSTPGENIDTDLKGVQAVCKGFADSLYPQISKKAGEIIGAIKSDLTSLGITKTGDNYEKDLISAVQLILHHLVGAARGAAMELHSLVNEQKQIGGEQTTMSKVIEEAHTKAKSLHSQLQQATGKIGGRTSGTNHAQAVDTAISQVETQVEHISGSTNNVNLGSNDISQKRNTAYEPLNDAITSINGYSDKGLDVSLTTKALESLSTGIQSKLEALKKAMAEAGQKINEQLTDLKNKISKGNPNREGLQKIHDQLHTLQNKTLGKVIEDTNELLSFATRRSQETIEQLHQHVDSQVEEKKKQLTTQAKKHYVSSLKTALSHFSSKIQNELKLLPAMLAEDLKQGYKGFMKAFEGETSKNINLLVGVKEQKDLQPLSSAFATFIGPLSEYLRTEIQRLETETARRKDKLSWAERKYVENVYTSKIESVSNELSRVLGYIGGLNRYDHKVPGMLAELAEALNGLHPESFAEPTTPLLDAIGKGVGAFVQELRYVYISSYDSRRIEWQTIDQAEKEKYAKIMFSITPILLCSLSELVEDLEKENSKWKNYKMYSLTPSNSTLHALFFRENGYDVGSESTTPYGELNHRDNFTGNSIVNIFSSLTHKLFASSKPVDLSSDLPTDSAGLTVEVTTDEGVIPNLNSYMQFYFNVCHTTHIDKPRTPCSMYEMLLWLTGLPFNAVYEKLHEHCDSLFEKKREERDPDTAIPVPIPAYPKAIYNADISNAIEHVTSHAYMLLTGIVGTGDASTHYASDFPNNTLNLKYPGSGNECLSMLLDVLRMLCPVLKFILVQCKLGPSDRGWARCLYGKDVPTTKSQCSKGSTNKAKCQPTCQANGQATCQANGQATSPLMCYLEDCLPGHLPHQLISVGCKSECLTCSPKSRGMPCLMPLGFRGFSGSTKTGRDLCEIIEIFFGSGKVAFLFCIGPKPPTSLPEHVGFALSVARGWRDGKRTLKTAIESHVTKVSINICDRPYVVTSAVGNAYGCSQSDHGAFHPQEGSADLASLSMTITCATQQCAPYMCSLSSDAYEYMAEKNANLFLSWCLYLPWQLLEYLQKLLDAFNDISCQDWGCSSCLIGDKCRRGKHGSTDEKSKRPHCECTSLVNCRGVSPTLYRYGFAFGNAFTLNNRSTRKRCCDLYTQLSKVLSSKYFEQLFITIDKFIFTIRAPFMNTLLALWSLSLLYLLHIAVVRLDVLRIRSHLRSPASHRIAAQSLLAAARVRALANVKYFST